MVLPKWIFDICQNGCVCERRGDPRWTGRREQFSVWSFIALRTMYLAAAVAIIDEDMKVDDAEYTERRYGVLQRRSGVVGGSSFPLFKAFVLFRYVLIESPTADGHYARLSGSLRSQRILPRVPLLCAPASSALRPPRTIAIKRIWIIPMFPPSCSNPSLDINTSSPSHRHHHHQEHDIATPLSTSMSHLDARVHSHSLCMEYPGAVRTLHQ